MITIITTATATVENNTNIITIMMATKGAFKDITRWHSMPTGSTDTTTLRPQTDGVGKTNNINASK